MPSPSRAWSAASITVVLWGSAFVAIRAALSDLTADELSVARLVLASLMLAAVAPWLGLRRPRARDIPALAACGATGMAAYQLLLNHGEETITAGTACMLVNTGPIWVALLAATFLREGAGRRLWFGLAVAFAGGTGIAFGQTGGVSLSSGVILVLLAALAQATFFVLEKPLLARYSAFELTAYATWSGALLSLPFGAGLLPAVLDAGPGALAALAFLGIGASCVGFFTWAFAIARLPVSTASAFLYTGPVVTIAVGVVWLGELPAPASLVGGAVALLGVAIATHPRFGARNGRRVDTASSRAAESAPHR